MATHVDYESAWVELGGWIATQKTGYGRDELTAKMAEIAAKHRMPEHFVHTVLRLYGGDVHLSIQTPETGTSPADELPKATADRKSSDPGSSTAERSHDERREAAPAG